VCGPVMSSIGPAFGDADYPDRPYPGARPDCSFVHLDGVGYPLDLHRDGWRADLDTWLTQHGAEALAARAPVLAYGSNACPSKITRPGIIEDHALWLATPAQLAALDRCEGRGERYDLAQVHTGRVTSETGAVWPDVLAYVGRTAIRRPLLVDGQLVRCADVSQADARLLSGRPADSDGLERTVVEPVHP
jgi:hypothetical protein